MTKQKREESAMNDKFFDLPKEKQERIINAGFRVFSRNSYKKSPVQQIADEAGISKSLLFFYFKNMKELFLFLMKKVEEITTQALLASKCYEASNIFHMMYLGLQAKVGIMKDYPDITNFSVKAYYDDDPDIRDDVRKIVQPYTKLETNRSIPPLDPKDFKEGIDLRLMYRDMYLASEGYIWQMSQASVIDVKKMMQEYKEMIEFWRELYARKEDK